MLKFVIGILLLLCIADKLLFDFFFEDVGGVIDVGLLIMSFGFNGDDWSCVAFGAPVFDVFRLRRFVGVRSK